VCTRTPLMFKQASYSDDTELAWQGAWLTKNGTFNSTLLLPVPCAAMTCSTSECAC
jgi:hypothetical protein